MAGLFISYRRDDRPGFAGRLADALGERLGAENVFRDVEDIYPGDDFVVAIQKQLHAVGAMLVMIGPGWLTASRGGVRRLDDATDFVRLEIKAGLESGKPVLPVLVDGASMPAEADLPSDIAPLARRQALVLSDASWATDVARLVEFVRPHLSLRKRLRLSPGAASSLAAGITLVALLTFTYLKPAPTPSATSAPQAPENVDGRVAGRWTAKIKYDWGAVYDETFELRVENGEIHGTASFLRLPRTVEDGQLRGARLAFSTHTQEVASDNLPREQTHRYRGEFASGELRMVLETSGGLSAHTPVEFTARRVSE